MEAYGEYRLPIEYVDQVTFFVSTRSAKQLVEESNPLCGLYTRAHQNMCGVESHWDFVVWSKTWYHRVTECFAEAKELCCAEVKFWVVRHQETL